MKKQTVAIVIPTIRNLDFLEEWGDEFRDCIGIIVEDHQKKEIKTPNKFFKKVFHFTRKDIDKELGKNGWIISRKNAGIRSFGFFKAHQLKTDVIITLDDDCYPVKNQDFLKQHLENLSILAPVDWYPTYPHRKYFYTRGIPYGIRNKKEVVISHGLWSNVLDFDAPTHLLNMNLSIPASFPFIEFIPENYFFPMCSMNLAFKTKITPLMYFPPMGYDNKGKSWGYDRFDDIWTGIFAKKIIDHLGFVVVNGSPFVEHRKASNVFKNLQKEARGIEINETLYKSVQAVKLRSNTMRDCYLELAEKIQFPGENYFSNLKNAMLVWGAG
ncbi:hypothetical protein A2767_07745 [Candidatus Roizmanbacteria bacterium RIFCSPHIGHO2_01_FULL_35_10]|uniref:Glycosyltransferase 2-like domain-containing protein n=1 Tax=Candidatus Roizmanbacteria bacterium RIFCSPLOWO2_01_FULL_35_13 TaxID=1802055 RepID=A0A1F7ICS6_9BACT|nr:MAG: hypothetical protein A2767_07745 [Candidatus Roizmanbacteria bacterium RIFCSPHIGHO2_01_FULL_35_10]OGK41159.1 MAG: hypothetical protein A3A74_02340 [Candidatus Roizmanbacteria bacterium RIFCSPLOWO2_01_FULL_35_13]